MALVGRPGANKSHPLKTAFEPLFRFDKEQKEIYNEEYRKYESIMSLSKKERLEQGFDMFPKEPVRTRFLRATFAFTWMNSKGGSIISHATTKARKNSSTYHCSMGTCIFPTAK